MKEALKCNACADFFLSSGFGLTLGDVAGGRSWQMNSLTRAGGFVHLGVAFLFWRTGDGRQPKQW
jgi:hypothetical protein